MAISYFLRTLQLTFLLFAFSLLPQSAEAMKIQKVKSPGGIEAWLVEEHAIPLISMRFAFIGGALQDPDQKPGVAYFVSAMLDEGAGDLESTAFQERREELAAKIRFNASMDVFSGSFQTLTERRDGAFELLRLALNEPRFDNEAIERIRGQIVTGLKFDLTDPGKVASMEWSKLAFGEHPYARPLKGSFESLKAIAQEDLKTYAKKVFARDNLKISVVGDIDAKTLGVLLDKVFGKLPVKADLKKVEEAKAPQGPKDKTIEMDVPQSVVQFGHGGIKRKDKDFIPAYVTNYILGGGGFSSRLTTEVREKRGLAYSVYSYLSPQKYGAVYIGGVATKNKDVKQSIEVIRQELQRMAKDGPTSKELENAKQYLTGSYPLRFDTNSKIASQLLWIQVEDLGADYIKNRNKMIEAVTLEEIRRVAKRLLKADGLILTIVGKPEKVEKKSEAKPKEKVRG